MDGLNQYLDRLVGISKARQARLNVFRAFVPLVVFMGLLVCFVSLGGLDDLPPIGQAIFSVALVPIFAAFGYYAWKRWLSADVQDIEAAIDAQSDMRILSSLRDKPSKLDAESLALWSQHRKKLEVSAAKLKPMNLGKLWRKADPYLGVRFGLPLLVLGSILFAGNAANARLASVLNPDVGLLFGADRIEVVAWVTPPEYTQTPPVYLDKNTSTIDAVENAIITVRASLNRGKPTLVAVNQSGEAQNIPLEKGPDSVWFAETSLTENTQILVKYWGVRRDWRVNVSPDNAPDIKFISDPKTDMKDRLLVDWQAQDDFGVAQINLGITLAGAEPAPQAAERLIALNLEGPPRPERENLSVLNLTQHAWAGLPVTLRLQALDQAGQVGYSGTVDMTLPEYVFIKPLARAIQEVRTDVLREFAPYGLAAIDERVLSPARFAPIGVTRAITKLDDLRQYPQFYYRDKALFLGLSLAHARLESSRGLEEAYGVSGLLWQAAMKAEFGSSEDARAALEAARKALDRGLRNRVGPSTLRRLMEAYQQAVQNYLAARMAEGLASDQPKKDDTPSAGGGGAGLTMADIEKMMRRLEALTKAGETEKAAALLAEISRLLEQLQFQQGQGGSSYGSMPGGEGDESSEEDADETSEFEQELSEKLAELSDLLRQQRDVNDDTLAQQRQKSTLGREGQGEPSNPGESMDGDGGNSGSGSSGGAQADQSGQDGESLFERQSKLRESAEAFGSNRGFELGDGLADDGAGEFGEFGDSQSAGDANTDENGEGGGGQSGDEMAEIDGEGERAENSADQRGQRADGSGIMGQALSDKDIEALRAILDDMSEAEQALARDNFRKANNDQSKIINSLRDLSADLSQRLDQARAVRKGESAARNDGRGDPLGRSLGAAGVGDNVSIPEKQIRQRAQDILDQIRQRYTEAETEEEREYLESLLDQF